MAIDIKSIGIIGSGQMGKGIAHVCAGAGLAIGVGMGFGGAWIATVIGLAGLALVIQLLVTLFSMAF